MSNRKAPGGLPQLSQPPALDEVLKWFKEDWPDAPDYPNSDHCRFFVRNRLQAIVDRELGRARAVKPPPIDESKDVRAALRMIPNLRRTLQRGAEIFTIRLEDGSTCHGREWEWCQVSLAALDRTETDLCIVKENLEALRPRHPPERPAHYLADGVIEAWRCINIEVPSSPKEGSPLIAFVQRGLQSIGIVYSDHSIIAALKGKRALARRNGNGDVEP